MERLCLFGGSFDPVHAGHLLVAQAAYEELPAARVVFIPAWQSPFKPETQPAPPEKRMQMLRTALAGKPWCEVDDLELRRGGVSYTIDTLRAYAGRHPEAKLSYIIGADNVGQLGQWREAGELAKLAEFVAVPRPGMEPEQAPPGFNVRVLRGFPMGVSSSQIRERVQAGLPVWGLLPPGVGEIIRNNRLYL
jgi:nicotinate-nucleotide adenylyltransferase